MNALKSSGREVIVLLLLLLLFYFRCCYCCFSLSLKRGIHPRHSCLVYYVPRWISVDKKEFASWKVGQRWCCLNWKIYSQSSTSYPCRSLFFTFKVHTMHGRTYSTHLNCCWQKRCFDHNAFCAFILILVMFTNPYNEHPEKSHLM